MEDAEAAVQEVQFKAAALETELKEREAKEAAMAEETALREKQLQEQLQAHEELMRKEQEARQALDDRRRQPEETITASGSDPNFRITCHRARN